MRSTFLRTLVAGALLLGSAAAQSASYRTFGAPCAGGRLIPGAGPVPLVPIGLPRLGSVFEIETESSGRAITGQGRQVQLFTGVSDTGFGGIPLPLDLAPLFPDWLVCGALVTSIELVDPAPSIGDLSLSVRIAFPIPRDASLLGLPFFQQVLVQESSSFGPPFRALAVSVGGAGVIGF